VQEVTNRTSNTIYPNKIIENLLFMIPPKNA
jgi:hypothetical protein